MSGFLFGVWLGCGSANVAAAMLVCGGQPRDLLRIMSWADVAIELLVGPLGWPRAAQRLKRGRL